MYHVTLVTSAYPLIVTTTTPSAVSYITADKILAINNILQGITKLALMFIYQHV